jgi:hypothetical protein
MTLNIRSTVTFFALWAALVSGALAQTPPGNANPASTLGSDAEKSDARLSAENWLGTVDKGAILESRRALSPTASVDEKTWQADMVQARKDFGLPQGRRFRDMHLYLQAETREKQDFYLVEYYSVSIEAGALRELVRMVKDADGVWRAAGYTIEPRRPGVDEHEE